MSRQCRPSTLCSPLKAALDTARADAAAAAAAAAQRDAAAQAELKELKEAQAVAAAAPAPAVDTRRSLEDEELFSTLAAEKKDAEARALLLEGNVASLQVTSLRLSHACFVCSAHGTAAWLTLRHATPLSVEANLPVYAPLSSPLSSPLCSPI